jgi:signal transduction histidine kinase
MKQLNPRWLVGLGLLLTVGSIVLYVHVLNRFGLTPFLPEWLWVNLAVGWVSVVAGVAAARRRPDSRIGFLMSLFGLLWMFRLLLIHPMTQWIDVVSAIALFGLLLVILLAFPSGHLNGWERWAAGLWLAYVFLAATTWVAFRDFYYGIDDSECCPSHLLLVRHDPLVADDIESWATLGGAVVVAGLLVLLFVRWRRASRAERGDLTVGTIALPFMTLLVIAPLITDQWDELLLDSRQDLWLQSTALLILPGVTLASLLAGRLSHARVADMMQRVSADSTAQQVESELRHALRDPSATLLFTVDGSRSMVNVDGRPHPDDPAMTVSRIDNNIAIAHDPALDETLVMAAGTGARMAINNVRLQAELRSQLILVRESRRRLVEATDEARRSVERDLHDGAQQRLVTLSSNLKSAMAGSSPQIEKLLADAARETDFAIAELRDLARGVHPAILTQAGIGPAVASLVDTAPIPVSLDAPNERFDPSIEATAYFVITEALTNTFKHSGATHAEVTILRENDMLQVRVSDDGNGNVDRNGTGIRGLEDRVAALGGRLDLSVHQGTQLLALLPLDMEPGP